MTLPPLTVLVDQNVWPEFAEAVRGIGERFSGPSGHVYALRMQGAELTVDLLLEGLAETPSQDTIDNDLLELACVVHDAVGEPWSGDRLRQLAPNWGLGSSR